MSSPWRNPLPVCFSLEAAVRAFAQVSPVYLYIVLSLTVFNIMEQDVAPWCDWSSVRSFMVDPLSYFLFQPLLHNV